MNCANLLFTNIISAIRVVILDIKVWTGRKKLRPEDLKLADGSELPPESLASLGTKRVMDPERIAPFLTLRIKAQRTALSMGTRFLGGYAIPVEKLDSFMEELMKIEAEFQTEKETFLEQYDEAVSSWVAANPGWESVIKDAEADVASVNKSISFAAQVFSITPVEEHMQGLEEEVSGLAAQLRREVQQMALAAWNVSFKGRTEVGQKALRPIRAMIQKIEGLVFLEPSLGELVNGLKQTFDSVAPKGNIKGRDFAAICGILQVLGNIPDPGIVLAAVDALDAASEDGTEDLPDEPAATVTSEATPSEWF